MYGAAIFTSPKHFDPSSINSGALALGCLGDDHIIRNIGGTGELANNIKWLTNLTSDVAYQAQLKNTPKLLEDKYLRTAVSSILLELGMKHFSLAEKASAISEIFNNTMMLANKFFGISEAPKGALAAGIATKIGHYQITIEDKHLVQSVAQSIQPFTNCERRINPNPQANIDFISVVLPRLEHAKALLSEGVPMDNLVWLSESQLPNKSHRLNWACNSHLPLLVEIKIANISRAYSGLLNWGNGAGSILGRQTYTVSNERLFVTNNELIHLAKFSTIDVGRIALCESELDTRYTLPYESELAVTSYSYGLLMENLWCSLLRDNNGQYRRGFACSWLHAADRMRCLNFAKLLFDKGYSINGYGYGRIILAVSSDERDDLKKDCQTLGLLPCIDNSTSANNSGDFEDVKTASKMNQLIFCEGRRDLIQLFDKAFIDEVVNG